MNDKTENIREVKSPSGKHIISIDQWVSKYEQNIAKKRLKDLDEPLEKDQLTRREELHDLQLRYEQFASSGNFIQKAWYSARLLFLKNSPEYRREVLGAR